MVGYKSQSLPFTIASSVAILQALPCPAVGRCAVLCGDKVSCFTCIFLVTHTLVVGLSPVLFPGIPR